MIRLVPTTFQDVQKYFQDFQRHSRCFEMPPDGAGILNIYYDKELVGYFILVNQFPVLEVNQGYLRKEYRHLGLAPKCMEELRNVAKAAKFKTITLQTMNRFNSYLKFAKHFGFRPERLIFSRSVN